MSSLQILPRELVVRAGRKDNGGVIRAVGRAWHSVGSRPLWTPAPWMAHPSSGLRVARAWWQRRSPHGCGHFRDNVIIAPPHARAPHKQEPGTRHRKGTLLNNSDDDTLASEIRTSSHAGPKVARTSNRARAGNPAGASVGLLRVRVRGPFNGAAQSIGQSGEVGWCLILHWGARVLPVPSPFPC